MDLTKDLILAAADAALEPLEIPEWAGRVFIRSMTAGERDAWEARCLDARGSADVPPTPVNFRASLAAVCLADATGNRLFGDSPADLAALSARNAAALDRIYTAAVRVNRLSAKDVKDLEGNSVAGPVEGSSLTSPATSG